MTPMSNRSGQRDRGGHHILNFATTIENWFQKSCYSNLLPTSRDFERKSRA